MENADSWPTRASRVQQVLSDAVRDSARVPEPVPEVREAWRLIEASAGRSSVRSVAREVGWSERHLGVRLRREVGVAPKTAARLARFSRARRALASGMRAADVAYLCGYADQSHLTREFTAFASLSPGQWRRRDLFAGSGSFKTDGAQTGDAG